MSQLNKKIRTCWGAGDFGINFMTTVETTYFMFFLTSIAKLPMGTAAVISSVTGICDIVLAAVSGVIIDKSNLKWGKNRSWFLITMPFILIFFTLMFTKVGGDTTAAVIITIGYLVCHTFFNIAWAAARAIVGTLSSDPGDRAFLSARISIGGALGKLASSKLVPLLVATFAAVFASEPVVCYTITAFVGAAVMGLGMVVSFIITKGYDGAQTEEAPKPAVQGPSFGEMLVSSLKNKYLVLLIISELTRMTGFFFITSMASYYCQISLDNVGAVGTFMMVYNLGTLVGTLFLSKALAVRLGTKKAAILGTLGFALLTGLSFFAASNYLAVVVIMCLSQVFCGITSGIIVGMFANCGTYGEYVSGKNTRGFTMGLYSVTIKLGLVVRGWILTGALALIGYNPDAIDLSLAGSVNGVFFLLSAVIILIGLIPMAFFNLKDSDIPKMEAAIAQRRAAE